MADGVYITEIFNLFPELPELIQRAVIKATKKTAFNIQRLAMENAPFDLGFLQSSIYVVLKDESNYGQGAKDPQPGAYLMDPVDPPESPTIAYIAVGANYGIYQEMGTVHMPPHPYLVPAAEAIFPAYEAALTALEDTLELP